MQKEKTNPAGVNFQTVFDQRSHFLISNLIIAPCLKEVYEQIHDLNTIAGSTRVTF